MRSSTKWGALPALLGTVVVIAALVTACGGGGSKKGGGETTTSSKPIVIGWAYDLKGQMAPFDNPALAAAKIRVQEINAGDGVGGRKLQIRTCNTQNNDPSKAKSCALNLLDGGADVIFTTCDVDFATPVVQEAIKRGKLAVAPCIGTDQMGPKRFGADGKLAFSFGNVAQDEGSAMAEFANSQGWKTAGLATNTLLVYFKNVVQAFEIRFRELGGTIVDKENYATGANNVGAAVSRLNSHKADVYVTATAFGELPGFVSGLRSLKNNTPILNSWAGDGTYWVTKSPQVTNYYFVTYASVFGDDPGADVKQMIASMTQAGAQPFTGGFLGGADAIDGLVAAIKRADGSLDGSALADQMEKFDHLAVLGGKISFSPELHTVFGREYRVLKIQNNKASYVGPVTAKKVPELP